MTFVPNSVVQGLPAGYSSGSSSGGSSTGAIVGGIIGGLIFVVIVIGIVFYFRQGRHASFTPAVYTQSDADDLESDGITVKKQRGGSNWSSTNPTFGEDEKLRSQDVEMEEVTATFKKKDSDTNLYL